MGIPVLPGGLGAASFRNTFNVLVPGQIPACPYDISKVIYDKNFPSRPLTVLLNTMGTKKGWSERHRWHEDEMIDEMDTVVGSVVVGATTIIVTNPAWFMQYDVLAFTAYRAQCQIQTINQATGAIVVTWQWAPIVPIVPGATFVKIGNAHPEVSVHNAGPTTLPLEYENVFQDMRHGHAESDAHAADPTRFTQKDWQRQMRKKWNEHKREEEKTDWFGRMAYDTVTAATPIGFSQGIYYRCVTNRTNLAGAVLTQATLNTFLATTMLANIQEDQNWWLFCAEGINALVSQWMYPTERGTTDTHTFGMYCGRYRPPFRNTPVRVVTHPMFRWHGWNDLAVLVNMSKTNIRRVVRTRFDTRLYQSIMPFGLTARDQFWRTFFTLEFCGEDINIAVLEGVAVAY